MEKAGGQQSQDWSPSCPLPEEHEPLTQAPFPKTCHPLSGSPGLFSPAGFNSKLTALEAFPIFFFYIEFKVSVWRIHKTPGVYFKYICCAGDVYTKPWVRSLAQNKSKFISALA